MKRSLSRGGMLAFALSLCAPAFAQIGKSPGGSPGAAAGSSILSPAPGGSFSTAPGGSWGLDTRSNPNYNLGGQNAETARSTLFGEPFGNANSGNTNPGNAPGAVVKPGIGTPNALNGFFQDQPPDASISGANTRILDTYNNTYNNNSNNSYNQDANRSR